MARELLFGPEMVLMFVADGQNIGDKGGEKKMSRRYEDAGKEVHQRCENYMIIHKTDYATAMVSILNADPILKDQYTGIGTENETYSEYPAGKQTQADISAEVDRRIKNLMRENSALSYPEAMIEVLQADPELKQAYHGSYYKKFSTP